ncbi:UNVERIFIED_CONTAM: RHS repeat-associated protein [Acetivibrio alkalicellulosi]
MNSEREVSTSQTIYAYDFNGNQLRTIRNGMIVVQNEYNDKNQLIRTEANGNVVINTYNGEGLRVAKSANGSLTRYLYEFDKVVLEVVIEPGQADKVNRNLYGTNLLMRTVDNESYYYMYNGHADVTALINTTTGVVAATYYYDAFGNILEQTGNVNNNITYAGYQWDKETGLYYLNARMYDPKIARFLQEDTYRGDPNDPLSLNLYSYCANNRVPNKALKTCW